MSFADDIKKFAKKTGNNASEQAVATLMKLNELVVKRTPVDTGRARGGWTASLGAISLNLGTVDKNGTKTISKCNAVAQKAPSNIYYLSNNVSYIGFLELGSSKQAPSGMLRKSIKEIGDLIGGG